MREKTKLEASIHKFKGNMTLSQKWLDRMGYKKTNILESVKFGDYLYYNGSTIEVIDNPQYKYGN